MGLRAKERGSMEVRDIVGEIDREIARLQQARALLAGESGQRTGRAGRKSAAKKTAKSTGPRRRKLSAEGRKRIAEAMRRRWAERKKQAAAKSSK